MALSAPQNGLKYSQIFFFFFFNKIINIFLIKEFRKKLSANGVLYINIDNIIKGDYALQIKASPLTFDVLYQISKTISLEGKTLYDSWLDNEPNESKTLPR